MKRTHLVSLIAVAVALTTKSFVTIYIIIRLIYLYYMLDENNRVVKNRNRDAELMRMAILNPSLRGLDKRMVLSEEEIKVITSHFLANVPQIIELIGRDSKKVEELVRKSTLFEVKRVGSGDSGLHSENSLYKKGKVSNCTILILSGKLVIYSGRDSFKAEAGPWTTLAPDALLMRNDEFISDFSAYIESPELRYLLVAKSLDEQVLPQRLTIGKATNVSTLTTNQVHSKIDDAIRNSRDHISFKPNASSEKKSAVETSTSNYSFGIHNRDNNGTVYNPLQPSVTSNCAFGIISTDNNETIYNPLQSPSLTSLQPPV